MKFYRRNSESADRAAHDSEIIFREPNTPEVVYDKSILANYTIIFDVYRYAEMMKRLGYSSENLERLRIKFTGKCDDNNSVFGENDVYGRYDEENGGEISIYLDAIYETTLTETEFEHECQKTLIHESGHAVDFVTGDHGQYSIETNIYGAFIGSSVVSTVAALGYISAEALRSKSYPSWKRRMVKYLSAAGIGSAGMIASYAYAKTDHHYYNADPNERFAREFADYHADKGEYLKIIPHNKNT